MHGLRKAVQQQHQRRAKLAGNQRVKGEAGRDRDFFKGGHAMS